MQKFIYTFFIFSSLFNLAFAAPFTIKKFLGGGGTAAMGKEYRFLYNDTGSPIVCPSGFSLEGSLRNAEPPGEAPGTRTTRGALGTGKWAHITSDYPSWSFISASGTNLSLSRDDFELHAGVWMGRLSLKLNGSQVAGASVLRQATTFTSTTTYYKWALGFCLEN